MKILFFKFQQNRTIYEEFEFFVAGGEGVGEFIFHLISNFQLSLVYLYQCSVSNFRKDAL